MNINHGIHRIHGTAGNIPVPILRSLRSFATNLPPASLSYYLPISSFLCTFFISAARNLHQEKELQPINMKQPILSERAKMFPLLLLIRCYNFRVFGVFGVFRGSFNFGCGYTALRGSWFNLLEEKS